MSDSKKVSVFIDGSNFYHASRQLLGNARVDFGHMISTLVGARELVRVYYYNAPVNRAEVPDGYKAQQRFFDALQKLPFFEIRLGRLERRQTGLVEKGVDVHLAVDMLFFAVRNQYDVAILISGDGDFNDAVQYVKDLGKHVEVAYPQGARAYRLEQIADRFIPLRREDLIP